MVGRLSYTAAACGLVICWPCFSQTTPFAYNLSAVENDIFAAFKLCRTKAGSDDGRVEMCTVIFIMNGEEQLYHRQMRRYCWRLIITDKSCDELILTAKNYVQNRRNRNDSPLKELCIRSNITDEECKTWFQLSLLQRPFGHLTTYEYYLTEYADGVTAATISSLKGLAKLLTDRDCTSRQASHSLSSALSSWTPQVVMMWQNPRPSVWRDTSRALIPCDRTYWLPNSFWDIRPMWGSADKGAALSRCPRGLMELSYPHCNRTSGLIGDCDAPWNLHCDALWKVNSSHSVVDDLCILQSNGEACSYQSIKTHILTNESSAVERFPKRANICDSSGFCRKNELQVPCRLYVFNLPSAVTTAETSIYSSSLPHCEIKMFNYTSLSWEVVAQDVYQAGAETVLRQAQQRIDSSTLNRNNTEVDDYDDERVGFGLGDALLMMVREIEAVSSQRDPPVIGLRIECPGWEWPLLRSFVSLFPSVVDIVDNIDVKLHFSESMRVNSYAAILSVATFWDEYVVARGFRLWHLHTVPYPAHLPLAERSLHSLLSRVGLPTTVHAYELRLHRPHKKFTCTRQSRRDGNIKRFQGFSKEYKDRVSANIEANEAEDSTSRVYHGSSDSYADTFRQVAFANRTIGIVQFDHTIHSEVVGPLVHLCESVGFQKVILYHNTPFLGEFRDSMLPIFEGWQDWDVRRTLDCWNETHVWDYLILITGDEVFKPALYHDVYLRVLEFKDRIIAIHHHPYWIIDEVTPQYLMLTPAKGRNKWIFPLIRPNKTLLAPTPPVLHHHHCHLLQSCSGGHSCGCNDGSLNTSGYIPGGQRYGSARHILLLLGGDISEPVPGNMFSKNKDLADIELFLAQNVTNFIVAMARSPNYFPVISAKYPAQTLGLWNLSSEDLLSTLNMFPMLWLPIARVSGYSDGIFTSSLAFGVAFRKTLVMPMHLSEMYDLSGAVVEYENSILEVDFDAVNHAKLRQKINLWEHAREVQNSINFLHCLTSGCD